MAKRNGHEQQRLQDVTLQYKSWKWRTIGSASE
jgi:hypothetical protein